MAVKTTLAWKYKMVKLEDLSLDQQRKLLQVAKAQVTGAQLVEASRLAFTADLARLRDTQPEFVLTHTPWGLAQLKRLLGGLNGGK